MDVRARTLLATPAPPAPSAAPGPRRTPPPLPPATALAKAERLDTLADSELSELLEASELIRDADLVDEEPGAITRATPPPEPPKKNSKTSTLAVVAGLVVSIVGVVAAVQFLEVEPLKASAALSSGDATAPLVAQTAPTAAPTATALASRPEKAPGAHAANPAASKSVQPKALAKAPRANTKHAKAPAPRTTVKKAGKTPTKK